jgi:predicted TIM-barrel fold metal-dependent hydrolase
MGKKLNFTIQPDDVIDIHVHIGGPPNENESMYYWSRSFEKSRAFEGMKLVTKLNVAQVTGPRYMSELYSQLKNSKHVDKVVLLAFDQVYTESGRVLKDKTDLYVANTYVEYLARTYPGFLYGCSVHPYAPDAIRRLWHCAKNGAVLCKWLPSSQGIDPTHPLAVRFYRACADLHLPLILHVGPEEAVPTNLPQEYEFLFNSAAGRYGKNPGDALAMAMDAGATLIIAHSAVPLGELLDKNNKYWEDIFLLILDRIQRTYAHKPLYADLSALCLPGRFKYVKDILPLAKKLPNKFLYGSDYPIPVVSFSDDKIMQNIFKSIGWIAGRVLPTNDFDTNYELLKKHFSDRSFTAATNVLRNPDRSMPDMQRFLKRHGAEKRPNIFSFIRNALHLSRRQHEKGPRHRE